jgi:hypothetical protein
VLGAAKGKKSTLGRGKLSFYRCGVVGAVAVDDVDVGELLSYNHNHDRRRSCCRAPERNWNCRVANVDEIAGLEGDFPHSRAS